MDRNWIIFFKNKLILILLVEHQPMNLQSTYFLNHIYIRSLVMSITLPDLSGLYRMCKPPRVYVCVCVCERLYECMFLLYLLPLCHGLLNLFIMCVLVAEPRCNFLHFWHHIVVNGDSKGLNFTCFYFHIHCFILHFKTLNFKV